MAEDMPLGCDTCQQLNTHLHGFPELVDVVLGGGDCHHQWHWRLSRLLSSCIEDFEVAAAPSPDPDL